MANLETLLSTIKNSPQLQTLSDEELAVITSNYQNSTPEQLDQVIASIQQSDLNYQKILAEGEKNAKLAADNLESATHDAKQFITKKRQEDLTLDHQQSQLDAQNILNKLNSL